MTEQIERLAACVARLNTIESGMRSYASVDVDQAADQVESAVDHLRIALHKLGCDEHGDPLPKIVHLP